MDTIAYAGRNWVRTAQSPNFPRELVFSSLFSLVHLSMNIQWPGKFWPLRTTHTPIALEVALVQEEPRFAPSACRDALQPSALYRAPPRAVMISNLAMQTHQIITRANVSSPVRTLRGVVTGVRVMPSTESRHCMVCDLVDDLDDSRHCAWESESGVEVAEGFPKERKGYQPLFRLTLRLDSCSLAKLPPRACPSTSWFGIRNPR